LALALTAAAGCEEDPGRVHVNLDCELEREELVPVVPVGTPTDLRVTCSAGRDDLTLEAVIIEVHFPSSLGDEDSEPDLTETVVAEQSDDAVSTEFTLEFTPPEMGLYVVYIDIDDPNISAISNYLLLGAE
jgi:hypothetical protein